LKDSLFQNISWSAMMNRLSGMKAVGVFSVLVAASLPVLGQSGGTINVLPGIDFSGNWAPIVHEDQPERGPGPALIDFAGLPITDGARMFAESWDASRLTVPEHQCQVHVLSYIHRGPYNARFWAIKDEQSQRLIAYREYISTYEQNRTIWMDGRPHPPAWAPHTWMGFSTGKWEGNVLTVTTTHMKQGWIRRNGLPVSDQATLVEHYIRHENIMTLMTVITDPVYLTEPLVKTTDLRYVLQEGQNWLYPCDYVVEIERPRGAVPHYLPGENPFMGEFAKEMGIPLEASLGGRETMYPEYQTKIRQLTSKK
jgi:hypothetical protein